MPVILILQDVPHCTADLTSAALMACGIGTLFHVIRFRLPFTRYYYGTGIVSVLGITTTQIVIGLNSISALQVLTQIMSLPFAFATPSLLASKASFLKNDCM